MVVRQKKLDFINFPTGRPTNDPNNIQNNTPIGAALKPSRYTFYNQVKEFNGKVYSGMRVGAGHSWTYRDGMWNERKISPDKWVFRYEAVKTRNRIAPVQSGAEIGSSFHWFILADQQAIKIDENSYNTIMDGVKFKVGHKRAHWRSWSYENPKYQSYTPYKERIIEILEQILQELKEE